MPQDKKISKGSAAPVRKSKTSASRTVKTQSAPKTKRKSSAKEIAVCSAETRKIVKPVSKKKQNKKLSSKTVSGFLNSKAKTESKIQTKDNEHYVVNCVGCKRSIYYVTLSKPGQAPAGLVVERVSGKRSAHSWGYVFCPHCGNAVITKFDETQIGVPE